MLETASIPLSVSKHCTLHVLWYNVWGSDRGTDKDSSQNCLEPEDEGKKLLRQSATIYQPTCFLIPEEW